MKPTEEQLKEFKLSAESWAIDRLGDIDTVIIDIESTGLLNKDPETEIVQLCVLNTRGRTLFSMMMKPSQPMGEEVMKIHGISNEEIVNQPIFPQVAKMIAFVLENKHVVSWNMDFDWRLLIHMFNKYNQTKPKVAGLSCAMDRYSEWSGEWNTKKEGFKWQRLPNFTGAEAHDAYNDCRNALKAIEKMASKFDPATLNADQVSLDF